MKTSVTRLLLVLNMILFGMLGCDPLENGPSRNDTENGVISGDDTVQESGQHLYVSGVSYPAGYDWRRDSAYGKVPCNIFLMRDGEVTCTIAAGGDESAAADPDRHHIIGGHIYTEHADRDQTVIKRDGKEILRYSGIETIRGMIIQEGKLITLGQPRYGQGFALRRNGKVLLSSVDGEILGSYSDKAYARSGALYDDNGRACFSYYTVRDGKRSWHFVEDGEDNALDSDGISTVYDMRVMMGDRYAVVRRSNGRAPVILSRGLPSDLSGSTAYNSANDYRLGLQEDRVFVVGRYRSTGKGYGTTGFWDEDGLVTTADCDCRAFRFSLGSLDYLKVDGGRVQSATFSGMTTAIQGDWCIMTPQCLCWTDDGPVLALSAPSGNASPAIWDGGTLTEIGVNGFLTGVSTGN